MLFCSSVYICVFTPVARLVGIYISLLHFVVCCWLICRPASTKLGIREWFMTVLIHLAFKSCCLARVLCAKMRLTGVLNENWACQMKTMPMVVHTATVLFLTFARIKIKSVNKSKEIERFRENYLNLPQKLKIGCFEKWCQ